VKWPTLALEELASVQRGKFSARPRNDPKYYGGDIPFIQTGDVATSSGRVRNYSQTLNADGLGVSKLFPKGSLAITIAANIGDVAKIEFDFACPDSLVVVQANEGVCIDWLRHSLQSKKALLESLAPQNAQKNINLEILRPLPFDVPPFEEQQAIANILDTWDAAIEKIEQLVAAKEQFLAGLRQDCFGKNRGVRNREWRLVYLSEVLTEHRQKCTGNESVFSVSVHKGLINQIEHLGRSFAASDTSNYNRVQLGDIVYTKSPTGDFPFGIVKQNYAKADVIVSPLYGVFSPVTQELGLLIDFYFESPKNAKNYLGPLIQKGAKNTISITNSGFLSGRLSLPLAINEQRRIAKVITEARKDIALLRLMKERYEVQKRGLMQKLLTGQWRVKLPETESA